MRLLKEKYKTYEGAAKRTAFENGVAKGEYDRGDKAYVYRYSTVTDPNRPEVWRVARERA